MSDMHVSLLVSMVLLIAFRTMITFKISASEGIKSVKKDGGNGLNQGSKYGSFLEYPNVLRGRWWMRDTGY